MKKDYTPATQAERESRLRATIAELREADDRFRDLCKTTAATMPADKRAHRAQIKALQEAAWRVARLEVRYGEGRQYAHWNATFDDIRCVELCDLVNAAYRKLYELPRSEGANRRDMELCLGFVGMQVNAAIVVLQALVAAASRVTLERAHD